MYKLRVYYTSGPNRGNLKREEFFSTFKAMDNRYRELFVYSNFGLNPTAWIFIDDIYGGTWKRLLEY